MYKKQVLIIGGGFAGVKCALELARRGLDDVHIRLVSDRSNFEYHGALYRLVAGGNPLEVCLPLRDIFEGLDVDVIEDSITTIDTKSREAEGASGSTYAYDYLVLGMGAQTNYFGIPGLEEYSYGMKTIRDALDLKSHIIETLALCPTQGLAERTKSLHFVIVGAGATGVELAGELAGYVRQLVAKHNLDPDLVQIDLVECADRILPKLHPKLARRIHRQLESMGVEIKLETTVDSLNHDEITLSGVVDHSPTVIWTAGVRANELVNQLGVEQDRAGRVIVDEHLQPQGHERIFVAGDMAATAFSGMAQTAIADGRYIADTIARLSQDSEALPKQYQPTDPIYAIPVGPGWAGTQWGRVRFYGKVGWFLRRLVDWVVFINFLPLKQAWGAFRAHYHVQNPTDVC